MLRGKLRCTDKHKRRPRVPDKPPNKAAPMPPNGKGNRLPAGRQSTRDQTPMLAIAKGRSDARSDRIGRSGSMRSVVVAESKNASARNAGVAGNNSASVRSADAGAIESTSTRSADGVENKSGSVRSADAEGNESTS